MTNIDPHPVAIDGQVYKISHSDVKSMNKCEYRWYYERYKNLMPIGGYPEVMEVGTFGHSLMEEAFKVIQAGGTYEEAATASGQLLVNVTDSLLKMKVYKNVLGFVAWFLEQGLRVVDIEDKQSYPVAPGVEFGFTPDITAEHTVGPLRGSLSIMDYKFTGQYWSDREINMFQQVPKYGLYKSLRTGLNISRGAVVMLNTRADAGATGNKLFLVKWIPFNKKRLENLRRENESMMRRIHSIKQYGDTHGEEKMKELLVHTGDEKACKFCFFADDLCPMEFDGRDVSKVIARNYRQNVDYGYNGEIETKADDAPRG